MNVAEAVERRMSVRAFRPDPVPPGIVEALLRRAAKSPSGGNLQPWRIHALTGEALGNLLSRVRDQGPDPVPGYEIYPQNLWDPYRSRRFQSGEDLYGALSIPREDKAARLKQLSRNAELFGAPVGIFAFIDRKMGPPQWSDLGMYLQTFMLLATEQGLDTCAQEYWSIYAKTIETCLQLPQEYMLFCGVAVGFRDDRAAINTLRTSRAPFGEWAHLSGFGAEG